MKALGSFETSGAVYPAEELNIPEDHSFDTVSLHFLPINQCNCYVNCIGRTAGLERIV